MIKINLLPKEKRLQKKRGERLREIVGLILLLYLAILANFVQVKLEKRDINNEILKIKKQLEGYKRIEEKEKEIKEKLEEAGEKIRIITKLLKKNTQAIKTVDFITRNIPQKEIFLEKIEYVKPKKEKKYTIYIQGNSVKLENIAKYIKRLERNNEFKGVILEETKNKKIGENNFVNFTIKIEL